MDNLSVLSAYDEKLIKTIDYLTESEIEKSLSNLHDLFSSHLMEFPLHKRIESLERLIQIMQASQIELVQLASLEGGKPLRDSQIEIERAVEGVKMAAAQLRTQADEMIPMGITPSTRQRLAFSMRKPRGLVLGISAFNHPVNLIVHQVIPAIAVGCPVIIKPSLKTPLSCLKFVELLIQSGVPSHMCQVIICKDQVTSKIAQDARISYLSFIGSDQVGWDLRSSLAIGVSCMLEHGGVAPVIVTSSSDLDRAVPALVKGGFYHAGQVCVSVQKVFVHENIFDDFCERMIQATQKLKVGDPLSDDTDVGPLITFAAAEKVNHQVQEAEQAGAKILCGGERLSRTCYAPTLLLNPDDDLEVSTKEIFGPVICLYRYTSEKEVIAKINQLPYAFQAAVFGQDLDLVLNLADHIEASAVMINDHTAFRADWMPFGGYKRSGLGEGGIPYAMQELSRKKLVVIHSTGL